MVLGQMNFGLAQILFSYFIFSTHSYHFTGHKKRIKIIWA